MGAISPNYAHQNISAVHIKCDHHIKRVNCRTQSVRNSYRHPFDTREFLQWYVLGQFVCESSGFTVVNSAMVFCQSEEDTTAP